VFGCNFPGFEPFKEKQADIKEKKKISMPPQQGDPPRFVMVVARKVYTCSGLCHEPSLEDIGNECGGNIKHVVAYSNYLHERLAEMIWND
jgi:hypothetical protein